MTGKLTRLALGAATAFAAGAFIAAADRAEAQDRPKAVIELYTSQGCSSCPPADALLGRYAKRDDVIALTFNVDYWDYLGWKDTLANPAHSARQRAYAKARGDGQVYTPQVVIDGKFHAVGSHDDAIRATIAKSRKKMKGARVSLDMQVRGDTLIIIAGAAPEGTSARPATIWLALVKTSKTVEITRGENRGKTITYFRVVRGLTPVGQWTGEAVTVKLPRHHLKNGEADSCAALLQEDKAGPILAATELRKW